jgi:hypothetical protein
MELFGNVDKVQACFTDIYQQWLQSPPQSHSTASSPLTLQAPPNFQKLD